jgi:hypothetical protein
MYKNSIYFHISIDTFYDKIHPSPPPPLGGNMVPGPEGEKNMSKQVCVNKGAKELFHKSMVNIFEAILFFISDELGNVGLGVICI